MSFRNGNKLRQASKVDQDVTRLQPFYYVHVLDQNTNVTRVEVGPQTLICQDHEHVVFGPQSMVVIPPRHYVVIKNPVKRHKDTGDLIKDRHDQVILKYGDEEVRLEQDPFPLYPGEELKSKIEQLELVPANNAYHLRALQNFVYQNGDNEEKKSAGDEWLFEGPGLYIPNPNIQKVRQVTAHVIQKNEALRMIAIQDCTDRNDSQRVAGEEWMVREVGAYLPGVFERVVSVVKAAVLTDRKAIHLRATKSFKDSFNNVRKNGEEWLVTREDCEAYIPSVNEEIVRVVDVTILTSRQYCVVLDPYNPKTHQNQLGAKKLIIGEDNFFLQPGERLEKGIQDIFVLSENEGLILTADEEFSENNRLRKPGDRWMIRGPMEYVPPVQARVVRKNVAIPLHENEGVYVRDIKTGQVRAVIGKTYLLNENEELWKKELTESVEELIQAPTEFGRIPESEMKKLKSKLKKRDKTRCVSYRAPHNSAVQIYDYKQKNARVIFGPSLVILGPDEMFTSLSLSGEQPKKPNQIHTLHLTLGPDFCTDIVSVETSDHARLNLTLSYSWQFKKPNGFAKRNDENKSDDIDLKAIDAWAHDLFSVSDFIGDLCKAVASRIRGAVAAVPFDDFHKNSARLIRNSVFGVNKQSGKIRDQFLMKQNNLLITGIDIKSIEPEDPKTRNALQKSVQQAIEITTEAQQSLARQEASRLGQEAQGKLDRQVINNRTESEKANKGLSLLEAQCKAVQKTGVARAKAEAQATKKAIEANSNVKVAQLQSKAKSIRLTGKMERLNRGRERELAYLRQKQEIETNHAKIMAQVETNKLQNMIEAIGQSTIKSIADAGPNLQKSLLQSLGIKNALITDGKQQINLFQSNRTSASDEMVSSLVNNNGFRD